MNATTTQDFALSDEQIINGRPARAVTLQEPIQRGDQLIETVHIRKPKSGELRGVNLSEVLTANTDAIMQVLPRVT